MFRIKTLLGGHLGLRDYNAQVGKVRAIVKALNRITLLGCHTVSGSHNRCARGSRTVG